MKTWLHLWLQNDPSSGNIYKRICFLIFLIVCCVHMIWAAVVLLICRICTKKRKTSGIILAFGGSLCLCFGWVYRGVPYGSRIAVWRGLFQQWCFPLNKWCSRSSPCPRGGRQVPLKGMKGCLHSYPARQSPNSFGREEWLFAPGLFGCIYSARGEELLQKSFI